MDTQAFCNIFISVVPVDNKADIGQKCNKV